MKIIFEENDTEEGISFVKSLIDLMKSIGVEAYDTIDNATIVEQEQEYDEFMQCFNDMLDKYKYPHDLSKWGALKPYINEVLMARFDGEACFNTNVLNLTRAYSSNNIHENECFEDDVLFRDFCFELVDLHDKTIA